MIRKRNISILILAIVIGTIGCNPGIIDVPPPQVTDASAYFWKNSGQVTFQKIDSVTGVKSAVTLNFSQNDSAGTFSINEINAGTKFDSISAAIGSTSVSISGITERSIIPLPVGFTIKSRVISVSQDSLPSMNHIMATTEKYVVASNNDLGIYFSSDSGRTWNKSSQTIAGAYNPVTAFAILRGTFYAGTYGGDILFSTDDGATWIKGANYQKQILAIAPLGDSGSFYVSVADSGVYFVRQPTSSLIGSRLQKNTVTIPPFTSLTVVVDSTNQTLLIGGTSGKGVYFRHGDGDWKQSGNIPSQASVSSLILTSNRFYCATKNNGIYYSDNGIIWISGDPMNNAFLAYSAPTESVLAINPQGTAHLINKNYGTYKATAQISHRLVNSDAASFSYYYAATDSGIYRLSYKETNWIPTSSGLSIQGSKDIEVPGTIVLLRSRVGSVALDSSWEACTMLKNQLNTPIIITGRIIGHLDSLSIGGTTYADVIGVRYADELSPNNIGPYPYWVVYYGKNEGPLVISQMLGLTTLSKALRQH